MTSTLQNHESSLLLVLGLPQSGCARVARLLKRCGAHEQTSELADQQLKLLVNLGCGWDSPLDLPDRSFSSAAAYKFEESLTQALSTDAGQMLKQAFLPGLERVLPIWHRALKTQGIQPQHVLVLRHPLEVAEQFRISDGWSRDHGLLVWLQSALAMERHSKSHQRVVLDLEQVCWDTDGALNRLEGRLQLMLPERNHRSLLEIDAADQSEFPASGLPAYGNADTSPLLQMALRLYGWLLAEANQSEREAHLPIAIYQQLQMAEALMGRTLSEVSTRSDKLSQAVENLSRRRLVRLSDWLRGNVPRRG